MAHNSFTVEANGIARILLTPIMISFPTMDESKISNAKVYECKGIWDTGATGSCITKKVSNSLGLIPTGAKDVHTAAGLVKQNSYEVNIYLPNKLIIPFVTVSECEALTSDPNEQIEVLIGMDIISLGDFCVTNHNGKTCMSFRIPSLHKIDYNKYSNGLPNEPYITGPKIGRNDPCHCGSKKKFKNCHGKTN